MCYLAVSVIIVIIIFVILCTLRGISFLFCLFCLVFVCIVLYYFVLPLKVNQLFNLPVILEGPRALVGRSLLLKQSPRRASIYCSSVSSAPQSTATRQWSLPTRRRVRRDVEDVTVYTVDPSRGNAIPPHTATL